MNSLSTWIYLASFLGGFRVLIFALGGCIMIYYFFLACREESPYPLKGTWISFVLFFIAIMVPAERTVYMIATSEISEEILNRPESAEILGAVKESILRELAPAEDGSQ